MLCVPMLSNMVPYLTTEYLKFGTTEELNFYFNNLNINIHMWLVASILELIVIVWAYIAFYFTPLFKNN